MLPANRFGRTVHFVCGFVFGIFLTLVLVGRFARRFDWDWGVLWFVVLGGALLSGFLASRYLDRFWNRS